jgi:broad specificity phosphatase PhoE
VRALETARILAEPHALEVAPDARLREFSFGEWEGLTWPQIVARRPHLRAAGPTVAVDYAPEGGETFAQVAARLRSFFDDLQPQDNERILIVTHAGPLHAVLSVLDLVDDGATAGVSFSPAGLTRIAMEGGRARLISLNDVRHLDSRG